MAGILAPLESIERATKLNSGQPRAIARGSGQQGIALRRAALCFHNAYNDAGEVIETHEHKGEFKVS